MKGHKHLSFFRKPHWLRLRHSDLAVNMDTFVSTTWADVSDPEPRRLRALTMSVRAHALAIVKKWGSLK
jgi:hypothetical protein